MTRKALDELPGEARDLIAAYAQLGLPPWEPANIPRIRELALGELALAGPPVRVAGVAELTCEGADGSLPARLYHPRSGAEAPGVLFLHGGGWATGTLDHVDALCRRLANASGCAVVSLAYRLAPEDPFPAGLEDAYAALAWIDDRRTDLGLAAGPLGVAGDSAGGNLAAALCILARDRQGPRIGAQALLYPALGAREPMASHDDYRSGYGLELADLARCWDCYLDGARPRGAGYAAPLEAEDLSGLPAAVIVTAECDPLRDEGMRYADLMRAAGGDVECWCCPGMPHGFLTADRVVPSARDAIELVGRALGLRLGAVASPAGGSDGGL